VFEATGRTALVTGAGQGVGTGIARALGRQGATVAVNDLVPARAEATAAGLVQDGIDAIAAPFDVTDPEAVAAGIAAIGRPVDILVNNAGIPPTMAPRKFRDMTPDDWRPYVDLNLYGSLHCIRAVIDGMADRDWGRIVQISSGAGRTGLAIGVSLYGASKSGIEGFLRHLACEVARTGVTVNTVALGLMSAPGRRPSGGERESTAGDTVDNLARGIPVGRLGTPDDVGALVVYVASQEASWMTGQTLNLNGGSVTS
jgi:NAD(P)-dependent dehydrogenase (short-subunit alcohol dehydrogenase family)